MPTNRSTQPSESTDQENSHSPCKKKVKDNTYQNFLGDVLFVREERAAPTVDQKIKDEIEFYLREYVDSKDSLVKGFCLRWWEKKAAHYPNLSRIAKKYLAIPSSSVPSERIWSLAVNIITKKRASLLPENLDMLVFLHYNRK